MNEFAQQMNLSLTHFDSPHGLQNIENLSCAFDMARLSAICIKHDYFRKIVSTPYYECFAKQKVIKAKKDSFIEDYDPYIKS
jgi:D-alanyl-D-alanine carboxypeptidase